eukprot:scaffold6320_cov126-Isochrysis_galbana.AAC.3
MGDPALYPEVRTARFLYAMQWLPRDFTADYQARQLWIDNTTSPISTASRSPTFITTMLTFVGTRVGCLS